MSLSPHILASAWAKLEKLGRCMFLQIMYQCLSKMCVCVLLLWCWGALFFIIQGLYTVKSMLYCCSKWMCVFACFQALSNVPDIPLRDMGSYHIYVANQRYMLCMFLPIRPWQEMTWQRIGCSKQVQYALHPTIELLCCLSLWEILAEYFW